MAAVAPSYMTADFIAKHVRIISSAADTATLIEEAKKVAASRQKAQTISASTLIGVTVQELSTYNSIIAQNQNAIKTNNHTAAVLENVSCAVTIGHTTLEVITNANVRCGLKQSGPKYVINHLESVATGSKSVKTSVPLASGTHVKL